MAFKYIAWFALLGAVSAGLLPAAQTYYAAPLHTAAVIKTQAPYAATPAPNHPASYNYAHAQPVLAQRDDDYDPHPQYKYSYDVQDAHSGDSKHQAEERDGDVVHGEYSLIDSDGFRRTVQYTADPVNGFNAVVNRVPLEHIKTARPVAAAAVPVPHNIVKAAQLPNAYYQHH